MADVAIRIPRSPLAPTLEELSRSDWEGKHRPLRPCGAPLPWGEASSPHPSQLCCATFPKGKAGGTDCHTSLRTGSQWHLLFWCAL